MNTKTKLVLAVGLLFALIIAVTFVGVRYISDLKTDSENILVDNYQSLGYVRGMLSALDDTTETPARLHDFARELQLQSNNVTEPGEKEAMRSLQAHFSALRIDTTASDSLRRLIRADLDTIMGLNMRAIETKNDRAKLTAGRATMAIALTGTAAFLIALILLINLPSAIAKPVQELTASIQEIAAGNYAERVQSRFQGEFGELARSFNTMAEKLEEFNESNVADLLFEKKRSEALIARMEEPVIGIDENEQISFANVRALNILGLSAPEVVGQPVTKVAAANDLMRSLTTGLTAPFGNSTPSAPIKIYQDGRESYFEKEVVDIRVTPTGERQAQHRGYVIVLKNVTPFKELDFAKSNFISTISHELKTPISSIKMSLQLLKSPSTGTINDEQSQLLASIGEDTERMLRITAELLDMTQVETGNIKLTIEPSDPSQVLNDAIEAAKVPAEQRSIRFDTITKLPLPRILADQQKTVWVLTNLLVNAIRYSPEGGRVEVKVEQQRNKVLFSVQDQGPGIEDRYQKRLFDRYYQVPGNSKQGTGLGLAICREFIAAQGGKIGVESELGMGSTFYFWLPVVL